MGSEIVCNSKEKKVVVEQEHRGGVRAVFYVLTWMMVILICYSHYTLLFVLCFIVNF